MLNLKKSLHNWIGFLKNLKFIYIANRAGIYKTHGKFVFYLLFNITLKNG